MREFKGTKGEWEFTPVTKESNGYINIEIPMGSITIYNGIYPYNIIEHRSKCIEILEANAKLIAAAPEMLEMLKDILEQENLSQSATDCVIDLIKKATE